MIVIFFMFYVFFFQHGGLHRTLNNSINRIMGDFIRILRKCWVFVTHIMHENLPFIKSLSHPGLGWLYVFSSFPPRLPRPPPQKLFPLMSKPFKLNLWYLAQRMYGSGEMYWMTFPWPWPKVTAVALISKNLLVCTIKSEPLIKSLQNVAAMLP